MATDEDVGEKFYLQKEQITDDADTEYNYEEVPEDEDYVATGVDEDLEGAVRTIQEISHDTTVLAPKEESVKATTNRRPEVVDDFVRNFLVRMNMQKSLDCFQTEWYELQQKGLLNIEDVGLVPDIYVRNQHLDQEMKYLRQESEKFKDATNKAKEFTEKLRKERDYHRMHHRRVVQEKNKLINDLKRLKDHYTFYEPTLKQLKSKYETAMKEKMLTKLERDRAVGQVMGLQSTLKNIESLRGGSAATSGSPGIRVEPSATTLKMVKKGSAMVIVDENGLGPTQRALVEEKNKFQLGRDVTNQAIPRFPKDSVFPPDNGVNPNLSMIKGPVGHLSRSGGFRLSNTIQAHSHAVSGVALHPRKQILVTSSDDHTWKMWAVPSGDIIMTGEGHTDWVADCEFHPSGSKLATASGDTTVKIWDFAKSECVHTFTEHSHPVWSLSWHSSGDFLASCSMDGTGRIWDLNSERCRHTLRGHADSVNAIQFLPYSNTLVTCSADKTVSLWDARKGLCAQTFYGHLYSVNDVSFAMKGDLIASCDSYGTLKIWDVRTCTQLSSADLGPHPANCVTFDSTGALVAVGSNDGSVRMYEVANGKYVNLHGHEDAVQCCVFDKGGEFLISGGSDLTARIWS